MKKITIILLLLSASVYGRKSPALSQGMDIADAMVYRPEFPGGINALYKDIGFNLKFMARKEATFGCHL